MKAILAILFLAYAAQAAYNTTAYNMGYYAMFNFNAEQTATVLGCIQGVHALGQDALNLVQSVSQGSQYILLAAVKLITDHPGQTIADCEDYKNYMAAYVQENAVIASGSTLQQTVEANLQIHAPEIIQAIAQWSEYIATGQDYLAGQTQAVVFQTLIGAYFFNYPVPTVDASDLVAFNPTEFYPEFYSAFFGTLGLTNQSAITVLTECGMSINNLTMDIIQLIQEHDQDENLLSNLPLIISGAESAYTTGKSCVEAFEIEKQLNAELIQAFETSPLMTIGQIMFNVAVNLPELMYQYQPELVAAIEQGDYALAGETEAEQQKALFNGLINYGN